MIRIVENFTGYPSGKKQRFKVGDEAQGLPADFVKLLIAKGHAIDLSAEAGSEALPNTSSPAARKQRNS